MTKEENFKGEIRQLSFYKNESIKYPKKAINKKRTLRENNRSFKKWKILRKAKDQTVNEEYVYLK